jgi:hypothetical protein
MNFTPILFVAFSGLALAQAPPAAVPEEGSAAEAIPTARPPAQQAPAQQQQPERTAPASAVVGGPPDAGGPKAAMSDSPSPRGAGVRPGDGSNVNGGPN